MNSIFEMLIKRSRQSEPPAPAIPTDYAFYAPLSSVSQTADTGQALSYSATPTALVDNGIPCLNCKGLTITSDDMTGMPTGNQSFTFCIWYRLPSTGSLTDLSLMVIGSNRSYDYPHIGVGKNSRMWFNFINSNYILTHSVDTSWHHMLGTYDASTRKRSLYLDGTLIGTYTMSSDANISSTGQIIIDFDKLNINTYLASARIYTRVLTDDEITALANEDLSQDQSDSSSSSGGSPVTPTDYVFRAPLQTSLNDVSSSARTATESGGSATVGEVKDGVTCTYIPQAVRLLYPIGNVNTGSGDRTFSLWFLTSTYASWGSLMTVGQNSSKAMFCIGTRTSSCLPVFSANGADLEPSSPSLKDGAWHHICATFSGTLVSLYVDGTLLGTKTITGLNTSSTDICIGGRPTATSDIAQNAWYADARIYNRAMTDADVAALYAKGINVE